MLNALREARSKKDRMKEPLVLTGLQARLQRGGDIPKECLPTPPGSPPVRLGIQEEICSEEL